MGEVILIEILAVPAEQSRGRHNPRAVKRKMSRFPTKARAGPAPRRVFRYEEHIQVVAPPAPGAQQRRAGASRSNAVAPPAPGAQEPSSPPEAPARRRRRKAPARPRCPAGLEHIRAWQASGLSRTAYCQRHGLKSRTFHRWVALARHTLRRKACTQAAEP